MLNHGLEICPKRPKKFNLKQTFKIVELNDGAKMFFRSLLNSTTSINFKSNFKPNLSNH